MEIGVNNKCKAFTSLEQSKKLAEILPHESADCFYATNDNIIITEHYITYLNGERNIPAYKGSIPCWSLAVLLELLDYPQLSKDKLGGGKVGWMVSVYPNDCRYDSCWHDNPIDACVAMIELLHKQKLL